MNILAIIASPHGMAGNTGRLLEEVLVGVAAAGGAGEIISLADMRIGPCLACDACHRTGDCPIDDGFTMVRDRLLACDAFILASPNYIYSVTAQMKALIDRCSGLVHGMMLEGKYGAAVESSGSGDDDEVLAYLERFILTLGAQSVGGIGTPMAGRRVFADEEAFLTRARELGRDLCLAVSGKRQFPRQDAFRREFRSRMERVVGCMKDYWPYEFDYWQNKTR
jgi:multimeric flavodoxin WrbA